MIQTTICSALGLLLVSVLSFNSDLHAATITVDTANQCNGGTNPADCAALGATGDSDGDCSLGEAIVAANTNREVDGCSSGDGTVTGTFGDDTIVIDPSLVATDTTGLTLFELAVLDGDLEFGTEDNNTDGENVLPIILDEDHVLQTAPGSITLDCNGAILDGRGTGRLFYLQEDQSNEDGVGGNLTINNCIIREGEANDSSGGAAVGLRGSVLAANDVYFIGNQSDENGGAIAMAESNSLTLTDVYFHSNGTSPGGVGGAVSFDENGLLTCERCTFEQNASSFGGAVTMFNTPLATFRDSAFVNNSAFFAGRGGGIFCSFAGLIITNTTFTGNSASEGGAMAVSGALGVFANVTVTNNGASIGGGMHVSGDRITLRNTVVAGNTAGSAPDVFGAIVSEGHNIIGDTAGMNGGAQSSDQFGTATVSELFATASFSTVPGQSHVPLDPCSAARDTGDDAVCNDADFDLAGDLDLDPSIPVPPIPAMVTQDQIGNDRVGTCDVGAIEFQEANPDLSACQGLTTDTDDNDSDDSDSTESEGEGDGDGSGDQAGVQGSCNSSLLQKNPIAPRSPWLIFGIGFFVLAVFRRTHKQVISKR